MPETPQYFIAKGQKEKAISSLQFLRGKTREGVQDEIAIIQKTVEDSMKNKSSFMDVFKNKASAKALVISAGLLSFQQLSGINAVLFYSTSIFIKAGGGLDPAVSTILVGAVMVGASGITPLVADKLGRKIILLFSAAGMTVSLVIFVKACFYKKLCVLIKRFVTVLFRTIFPFGFTRSRNCKVNFMATSCIVDCICLGILCWIWSTTMGCFR